MKNEKNEKNASTQRLTNKIKNWPDTRSSTTEQNRTHTPAEHRSPAPFSSLCQNWLRHWRGLFISAQLSTDAVRQSSTIRMVSVGASKTVETA